MDPGPDGPDGDGDGVGDLLVAEAHDVAEHDGGAEVLREAAQGGLNIVGESVGRLVGAAGVAGSRRSGSSGRTSTGRRRLRRTSSRKTFVTIRDNQPSIDPGW